MLNKIKYLTQILVFCFSFFSIAQNSTNYQALKWKLDSLEKLADLDKLDKPIREIKQATSSAYRINDSTLIAHALLIQSSINMYLDNDESFHKNLEKAHSYLTASSPKKHLVFFHNLNGIKHSLENDYKKGLDNYISALNFAKQDDLEWQQIDINYNIMIVAYRLKDYENSKKAVNEIIRISKKFDIELRLNQTYYYGALLAIQSKDFSTAEAYLRNSRLKFIKDKSASVSMVTEKANFLIAYSKLYEAKGDYKKANSYLKKHRELIIEENKKAREALARNINFEKNIEIKSNELIKSQTENKLKQKQIDLDRMLLVFSSIAFLGSLFFIYIQFKHSKSKSKSNALLLKTNNDLKEAKKEIEKNYNKNLILFNNLSHELKTPLHSINNLTDILKKNKHKTILENLKYINLLQQFNQTVFHFIEDAIYNTRDISAVSLSVLNEKTILKNFIFEVVTNAKQKHNYNFPININFDKELPSTIALDKIKIRQIINYLLSISLKENKDKNVSLNIKLNSKNHLDYTIEITITDNSKNYNQHSIFRTFKLQNETNKIYDDDVEFGLILAHKFAAIYNGELYFNCDSKNSVATLNLNLSNSTEIKLSNSITKKRNNSPKILIVEDNKVNRIFTKKIITNEGYSVDEAENGITALTKTKKEYYDIIFMDIMMPGMDGFETSKLIKKDNPSTEIIALSAITSLSNNNILAQSGISKFLRKPCLKTDLLSAINEFSNDEITVENHVSV